MVLSQVEVEVGGSFEPSPFAASLCIPLQLRLAASAEPGSTPQTTNPISRMVLLRLMMEPGIGLPMTWQSVSAGAMPAVVVTRADGLAFTEMEWRVLCEYIQYVDEELLEEEAPKASVFCDFIRSYLRNTNNPLQVHSRLL